MATNNHDRFVVGLFDDHGDAEKVARALHQANFSDINMRQRGESSGLTSYLERHGVPDSHSHFYAEGVRRGGTLVTVWTDDTHYASAVELMRNHGAIDINRRAQHYKSSGFNRYEETSQPYNDQQIAEDRKQYAGGNYGEDETVLPETEEKVHIGKQKVERGGVRVFAREKTVPVERNVTLRDETIHVDRRNVDRAATPEDLKAFKEGEVTITETDERPVVNKEARVTGEVHVGKTAEQRTEKVREQATKRKVDVEKVPAGTGGRR